MDLATRQDLEHWKNDIIQQVTNLIEGNMPKPVTWVKSLQAREMLGCSPGTIQTLRLNGTIEFSKVGGTLYYNLDSIRKILESNKQNAA